jgi:hypothetical protein
METKETPKAPATPAAKSDEPKQTKVTLKQPHEHAGEKFPAGAEIEVNPADEQWLREHKVI